MIETNSTHQQEHSAVGEVLQDADNAMEPVYDEFHNGDKKNNRKIMRVWELVKEARTMVRQHAARTAGDDAKLVKYHKLEKLMYVFGTIATGLVGKLAYDLVKMYGN